MTQVTHLVGGSVAITLELILFCMYLIILCVLCANDSERERMFIECLPLCQGVLVSFLCSLCLADCLGVRKDLLDRGTWVA